MIAVVISEAEFDRCFEETLQRLENTALIHKAKDVAVSASSDVPALTFREVNYAIRMLMSQLKKVERG